MKDTVEVIINEGGFTCTTTNAFGEKPKNCQECSCGLNEPYPCEEWVIWKQAENDRITYEIKNYIALLSDPPQHYYKPGTIHQARIENGKAVIL